MGSEPPAVDSRASCPKPLPTARVGVTVAQQLPLPFLPVGIVAAKKAVTMALPLSSLREKMRNLELKLNVAEAV
jgi:hypothetical protein